MEYEEGELSDLSNLEFHMYVSANIRVIQDNL